MGRSEQFYHGTTSAIKDGMVRPANDVDKNVSEYSMGDPGDMSEGDHAFVIRNNEHYAWHAANNFHPSLRRSRVYETEDAPDRKPGPWNAEHPDVMDHMETDDPADVENNAQDEWGSPTGFKVKRRIDIMPGRQGTFPGISWGRFSERPYDQRVNHPTDEDVKYGHRSSLADAALAAHKMNTEQFHNWRNDAAPHSELREMAGRPQKRIATLFD